MSLRDVDFFWVAGGSFGSVGDSEFEMWTAGRLALYSIISLALATLLNNPNTRHQRDDHRLPPYQGILDTLRNYWELIYQMYTFIEIQYRSLSKERPLDLCSEPLFPGHWTIDGSPFVEWFTSVQLIAKMISLKSPVWGMNVSKEIPLRMSDLALFIINLNALRYAIKQ